MKKLVATCAILGVFYLINIKQHIIKDAVLLMPLIFELYKVQLKNEQVDRDGNMVFMFACQNKMKEVALELIKTGYAKSEQIHNGCMDFIWACENGMTKVANELVSTGTFTINDIMLLKLEWITEELFIMNPVDVTEVDI